MRVAVAVGGGGAVGAKGSGDLRAEEWPLGIGGCLALRRGGEEDGAVDGEDREQREHLRHATMLRRRHERARVRGREGQRRHAPAEGRELAAPAEGAEREELLERGGEGRARWRLHEVEVVHVRDAEDLERG